MARTSTPISGRTISGQTLRRLTKPITSDSIHPGSKKRIGNDHGLAILEESEQMRNRMMEIEARLEKLEKQTENLQKQNKKLQKQSERLQKLEKTVEEHERRWNRVRSYELLNNGSKYAGFENSKPIGITSLERHEIVHGGDVILDLEALKSAGTKEDKEPFLAASKGFESFYGLSAEEYGSKIIDAQKGQKQVLDVLNIRSNVRNLRFWKKHEDKISKKNLLELADSIIKKWKSDPEGHLINSKSDFDKDYEMLRKLYESGRPAD